MERVGAEVELRAPAEDPSPRAPSPAKKKKSPATGCCGGRTGSLREDQLREEKKRALPVSRFRRPAATAPGAGAATGAAVVVAAAAANHRRGIASVTAVITEHAAAG